jgi:hypothetical protein
VVMDVELRFGGESLMGRAWLWDIKSLGKHIEGNRFCNPLPASTRRCQGCSRKQVKHGKWVISLIATNGTKMREIEMSLVQPLIMTNFSIMEGVNAFLACM